MVKEYIVTRNEELDIARKRFFPGWWTYMHKNSVFAPSYRVVCRTLEEYQLARIAKPEGINAKIIYRP